MSSKLRVPQGLEGEEGLDREDSATSLDFHEQIEKCLKAALYCSLNHQTFSIEIILKWKKPDKNLGKDDLKERRRRGCSSMSVWS